MPWERFSTRGALVYLGDGVGWVMLGTAYARPPPACLLTRMRSVPASGLHGDGANNALLPGIPTRMSELPIFEQLGFSSRSSRSTGRLMRSLAPWWGESRSEASSFFSPAETRRAAATSVWVFEAGPGPGLRTLELRPRATPRLPNPAGLRLAMNTYPV